MRSVIWDWDWADFFGVADTPWDWIWTWYWVFHLSASISLALAVYAAVFALMIPRRGRARGREWNVMSCTPVVYQKKQTFYLNFTCPSLRLQCTCLIRGLAHVNTVPISLHFLDIDILDKLQDSRYAKQSRNQELMTMIPYLHQRCTARHRR
jgi:hypothetical protein